VKDIKFELTSESNYTRHGMRNTRFYAIWSGMKYRCSNSSSKDFPNYGGKGISLSERWQYFPNFMVDMYDSYLAHSAIYGENNTTIDRLDNSGDYELSNCRWATRQIQGKNMRHDVSGRCRDKNGKFIGGKTYQVSDELKETLKDLKEA